MQRGGIVSVLFNEPKLLKPAAQTPEPPDARRFSALQRAEIAETPQSSTKSFCAASFSALQRAEIAETENAGLLLYN